MEKAHRSSELMETGTVAVNTPMVAIAEAPLVELSKLVMVVRVVQWQLKIT